MGFAAYVGIDLHQHIGVFLAALLARLHDRLQIEPLFVQ
jgi:hypothetical protein